jgi:hypothetical protein
MLNKRYWLLGFMVFLTVEVYAIKIPQEKKPPVPALYEKLWEKTYGGKDDDIAHDIVALEEGNSAIVGTCKSFGQSRSQICVIAINSQGDILWRLLLGGEKPDEGRAITRALDGGLYVLGMTRSLAKHYDRDVYVAKITVKGKLIWERALGGSRDEVAGGIVATDDGGVFIVGDTESFGDRRGDIYMAKLNQEGKILFERTTGGKKQDSARDLTRLSDGSIALAGMRESTTGNYEEFFVMKLNQSGKILWSKTFGEYDHDSLESIVATVDGGMVAVGKTRSYGSEQTDLTVMRLSAEGKTLWHKVYGFKYYEYGNTVTATADGGFILAGGTSTLGKGSHSLYTMALDKNGKLLWSHVYGDRNRDIAHGIAQMSDKSVVIVGQSDSFSHAKGFYMIKVNKVKKKED